MTEALRRQITITQELVTPSIARQWLDRNAEHNRNRKPNVIERYARDMKQGRWHDTGDPIRFDANGVLIDGQQRLNAVRESGASVLMTVARGLDPEAMIVIDTGTPRTFADTLKIEHSQNGSQVGSIVRRVLTWKAGNFMGKGGNIQPTRVELPTFYRNHMPALDTATQRGKDIVRQRLGNGTSAGTAFYLFAEIDKGMAHSFVDMVLTGANLPAGHPALTLSRRLAQRDWNTSEQLAGWIRCWNAFRTDRTMDKIQLTNSGPLTNANFPQPK